MIRYIKHQNLNVFQLSDRINKQKREKWIWRKNANNLRYEENFLNEDSWKMEMSHWRLYSRDRDLSILDNHKDEDNFKIEDDLHKDDNP